MTASTLPEEDGATIDGRSGPAGPAGSGRRGRRTGASYEHPIAFWLGVLITVGGVAAQLPMFFMARDVHYRLAGMPVTPAMSIGMGAMFVGVALTVYSLFPPRTTTMPARSFRISALDDAPIRPAHVGLLLVLGAAITIDVMKPTAFAFMAPGVAAEYGLRGPLNPHADALPIALYPLFGITGTAIGSLIWGWLGDRIGRRASILLAAVIFVATSSCGTMPEYWMNLVTCFLMGLGVGGMLPITFALMAETIPKRHRGWTMSLIGVNIAGAYVIVSWLSSTWASPAHFGWRLLWLIGIPSGLILLLLNHWIPESPRFLILRGREEEARRVMNRYGAQVIVEEAPPRARPEAPGSRLLFSRPLIGLSGAIILLALSIGITQYGLQQWIPSNLQQLGYSATESSQALRNAALIGLPLSVPVALLYGLWSSKKTVLLVSATVAAALLVFTALGSSVVGHRVLLNVLLVVPAWGISILSAVLAAYTAEVYPTAVRARGSGISAGATKAGGVAVLALVVAAVAMPSMRITAALGLVPIVLAILAVIVFGPETRGKQLEQITLEEMGAVGAAPGINVAEQQPNPVIDDRITLRPTADASTGERR